MNFDPKMFELHTAYAKHDHSYILGHMHLASDKGISAGQSLLRMCTGCGNFKVFHTSRLISPVSGWEYAYKLVLNASHHGLMELQIASYNNPELTEIFNKYVAAVKAGGYRPKEV